MTPLELTPPKRPPVIRMDPRDPDFKVCGGLGARSCLPREPAGLASAFFFRKCITSIHASQVLTHRQNVAETGPRWIGATKWDNAVSLWPRQGSRADVTYPVHDWDCNRVGEIVLDGRVFNYRIRTDLMHAYVRWQLAKRRQGTHKTKTRGEKRGGGRKPRPQKGSGMARLGSIRSPVMSKGSHAKARTPKVR